MSPISTPPSIPGLTYVSKLGEGGYADVYLFNQSMPIRQVAVKVIREANLSSAVTAQFRAEANAMARLEHPQIVPVYSVGTTEDGHQYLVMMYYPRENLAKRAKRERLSVPEVLRIGIQIGSAVETAHRAGLLHRDIKPANILVDKYGNPGLADFGIAAQMTDSDIDTGVSVPWSPPELLYGTTPASVRTDVYSLAATLWHLLVGRSPFEIPGGDNTQYGLMRRIKDGPAPSPGRADVPMSLESLLKSAMSTNPVARPATMLNFVRSLQGIEQELRLPRTPIVVPEDRIEATQPPSYLNPDKTVLKIPKVVAQSAPASHQDDDDLKTRVRPTPVHAQLNPDIGADEADMDIPRRPTRWWVVAATVLVIAAIVGLGVLLIKLGHEPGGDPTDTPDFASQHPDIIAGGPPGALQFKATPDGDQTKFTWTYANSQHGDTFEWYLDSAPKNIQTATQASVTVPTAATPGTTCIHVQVHQATGGVSDYTQMCG
ncbi:MAG: serine/threonine protein kinase [Propionibacteriaceae bacterium]|nr:serine/threonine protein kinase [Propionibacteriaceae bacterium]